MEEELEVVLLTLQSGVLAGWMEEDLPQLLIFFGGKTFFSFSVRFKGFWCSLCDLSPLTPHSTAQREVRFDLIYLLGRGGGGEKEAFVWEKLKRREKKKHLFLRRS